MNGFIRHILVLALTGWIGGMASARNTDGTLGLLQLPNNGVPAIVEAQGSFTAVLRQEATLSLSGAAGELPLETTWSRLPGGMQQAQCRPSSPVPPGVYALRAVDGNGTDINARAVYVVDSFPETYQVAHVTDTHIGKTGKLRPDTEILQAIIEAINASEASLTLITGDLTENGEPEQFQRFLGLLDLCRLPTFVVPGNHDRKADNYRRFFGPLTYYFTFGKDGYLAFDTKDYLIANELTGQDGLLHFYRRQIRASRWSIGFTHRYDVTMGIRAQITLFVDDPLDYLVYGHIHREAGERDGIPWGSTRAIITPAAIDGVFRVLRVDANGVHPLETIDTTANPNQKN